MQPLAPLRRPRASRNDEVIAGERFTLCGCDSRHFVLLVLYAGHACVAAQCRTEVGSGLREGFDDLRRLDLRFLGGVEARSYFW